ncbi:MAG: hypothetical protein ACXU82_11315 [Caulobacteraceae bacterium]
MSLSASASLPKKRPTDRPRPSFSDERLQALAAELLQAFARIARRRF